MKSKALNRYFLKPLELAIVFGFALMIIRTAFPEFNLFHNWAIVLAPLAIVLSTLTFLFLLIYIITWFDCSNTEL